MTSLINLMIASFLAMGAATPAPAAQAAARSEPPPAPRRAEGGQQTKCKAMPRFAGQMPRAGANGMPADWKPTPAK